MKWVANLGLLIAALLLGMMLFILFVIFPVSMWANAECAKRGFPKAEVLWNLDTYCMNLDGAVTTKMEKLK